MTEDRKEYLVNKYPELCSYFSLRKGKRDYFFYICVDLELLEAIETKRASCIYVLKNEP